MKLITSITLVTLLFVGCNNNASKEVSQEKTIVESPKKEIAPIKVVQKTVSTPKSAKELYRACVSCHGASAEKQALGKSQVIQGWSAQKVQTALSGYKNGSYGGTMKGLMKGQVLKLNDRDIQELSQYISKL